MALKNSPSQIPNFVTASSPQGLRRAMFKNNLRLGGFVMYDNIQFSDGKWFAWYQEEISDTFSKGNVDEEEGKIK